MPSWISHFFAASRWSAAGVIYLFRSEIAARMELGALAAGLVWLVLIGAGWPWIAGFVVLSAFVLALEALNTAIEVLVDHLSPAYAEFARHAKDLGSAAVFFGLSGTAIYVIAVSVATLGR
ncbi:diacylglycerol kinase [Prosthecomicrobium pneumaticum]|uniref:Diacylglycerol kinase n=1 Tax=Prosthecomicrobium pneumaticum TaxID=81895 RepID=A0A7W9FJ87_9HYPH|nr:diacylglycerol kinase [Prosthecomicrobium pneumaticum]MBB5751467.1 diacylglycerol kinase (ATP) [Prosthecomicrobium pneumaticum]